MLAAGGLKTAPKGAVREAGEPGDDRAEVRELTMTQAMREGKWTLLAWLENRGKAGTARP
jgi:hypothetical protein